MEIKQENFEELKQLDRIEYRQVHRLIMDGLKPTVTMWTIYFSFLTMGFLFLLYGVFYNHDPLSYQIARSISRLSVVLGFYILGSISLDLLISKKRDKELNKLDEKYFNVNFKNRKGGDK